MESLPAGKGRLTGGAVGGDSLTEVRWPLTESEDDSKQMTVDRKSVSSMMSIITVIGYTVIGI